MFIPDGAGGASALEVPTVPQISGPWTALRDRSERWRSAMVAATAGVEDQQSSWSAMRAAYDEPETNATVHTALDPLLDPAALLSSSVQQVAEAVQSFATTAASLESEADELQRRRAQVVQAAETVEVAEPGEDVDTQRLQTQDFNWDVAGLQHRWEQAQQDVSATIEQQSRLLAAVVLPQSAAASVFAAAGFGAGFSIGSALFGADGRFFDLSGVDVDLPPISQDMSEQQRRDYRKENPDALEKLMDLDLDELDEETREQVEEAIIALAVPRVDASDGETDAQTVEGALTEEDMADEMAEAFGRSSEIAAGLDSLQDWAASNDVDLQESDAVAGAMGYLGAFHRAVYARRDAVEKYLQDGARTEEHWFSADEYEQVASDEQLETIRRGWAEGLLTLSREDYGGGWDELPEEMRETVATREGLAGYQGYGTLLDLLGQAGTDVEPGDDLAVELAHSAQHALHVRNQTDQENLVAGPTEENAPEEALSTALELAGRNHAASAALLTGSTEVDGYDGGDLPAGHDPSTFVLTVFDHDWADDGAGAAALIDWIGPEHREYSTARADLSERYDGEELDEQLRALDAHADDAWYGLMEAVTDAGASGDAGVFDQLMGTGAESALTRNGELATAFYRTTAANLTEFTAAESMSSGNLTLDDRVGIMALLSSNDETAAMTAASVREFQAGRIAEYVRAGDVSEGAGGGLGRLQATMEAGIYDVAAREQRGPAEAEQQVMGVIQAGSQLGSIVFPHPVVEVGDVVIQHLDPGEMPSVDVDLGGGVEYENRGMLHRARVNGWILEALGGDSLGDIPDVNVPKSELPDDLIEAARPENRSEGGHRVEEYADDEHIPLNAIVDAYLDTSGERLDAFVEASEGGTVDTPRMKHMGDVFETEYDKFMDKYAHPATTDND